MERLYDDVKQLLHKEIDGIVKKGSLTPQELESLYKAIDVLKDICEIKEKKKAWRIPDTPAGCHGHTMIVTTTFIRIRALMADMVPMDIPCEETRLAGTAEKVPRST